MYRLSEAALSKHRNKKKKKAEIIGLENKEIQQKRKGQKILRGRVLKLIWYGEQPGQTAAEREKPRKKAKKTKSNKLTNKLKKTRVNDYLFSEFCESIEKDLMKSTLKKSKPQLFTNSKRNEKIQ